MKAWFFSKTDCRLRHGDNRKIKPGVIHTVDCKPVLCEQGLHGSVNIMDALKFAPGPYVWRVNLTGDVVRGNDKAVATSREYLWGFDATEILRKHARMSALDVIHLWNAPDVVARYLKTGDEFLRDAARAAARDAAQGVWYARKAAWNAARAAWNATRDARDARDAVWYAASYARKAAGAKQNNRLYRMVMAESRNHKGTEE